jgi:epoxyqueuosine reductase QueG
VNDLNAEIEAELRHAGADLVGYADLCALPPGPRAGLDRAVAIAVALDPAVVHGIRCGPTRPYHAEYRRVNTLLAELARRAVALLARRGYRAIAQIPTVSAVDPALRGMPLPHKTVATRAGLGWIGKSALLVTESFGPAVRLTAALTDAPLHSGTPVDTSRCGACTTCVAACPGGAIRGVNWYAGLPRQSFYDAHICRRTAAAHAAHAGIDETICGICIAVCPWTDRYLRREARLTMR